MEKKWYEKIDYFKLTGITFLWIASWLFMLPHQVMVNAPFFDNIWGAFFSVFGASKLEINNAQQLPDLMSGLIALLLMIILQLRGIFTVVTPDFEEDEKKSFNFLLVLLNIVSVLVHTLFFTMLIKIFLFPETGQVSTFYERLKINMGLTIFTACSITGMVFAVPSLSKFFMLLLFAVGVFKNISQISQMMGITGFVSVVFSVLGFYLEFMAGSIDKRRLLTDLVILSGHYESLYASSMQESEKIQAFTGKSKSLLKRAENLRKKEKVIASKKIPIEKKLSEEEK